MDSAPEPSLEPPPAALHTGGAWLSAVCIAAEHALPALRALLDDPGLIPQQALGALSFVADCFNRVLLHLEDPEGLAKFRRLKRTALHKKLPKAPERGEALLLAGGFCAPSADAEHLEWGLEEQALPATLAVLALISRVQERVQAAGLRTIADPLPAHIGVADIMALTYGKPQFLEPRADAAGGSGNTQSASSVGGALVTRAWLSERLPRFAKALEEFHSLFEPGAREKALARTVARVTIEARAEKAEGSVRLGSSALLGEFAQLAASAALLNLRIPDSILPCLALVEEEVLEEVPEPEALPDGPADEVPEPDGEPHELDSVADAPAMQETGEEGPPKALQTDVQIEPAADARQEAVASPQGDVVFPGRSPLLAPLPEGAGSSGHLIPTLLDCVPCFRLGIPHASFVEVMHMREAPAFFTMGVREKPFEVSLRALSERIISQWLSKPDVAAAILHPGVSCIGVGCALDIGNDDKAIVVAVIA